MARSTIFIGFRVPPAEWDYLQRLAEANDQTVSQVLRCVVRQLKAQRLVMDLALRPSPARGLPGQAPMDVQRATVREEVACP